MPCRFPGMDCLFPGLSPMIPAQLPALLDDAVAGYQKCDGVCPDRRPHGSGGIGMADYSRHLGIARHFGRRYLQQGVPNSDLKVRSGNMQGNGPVYFCFFAEHGPNHSQRSWAIFDQLRARPFFTQVGQMLAELRTFQKRKIADAPGSGGDKSPAEGRLMHGIFKG